MKLHVVSIYDIVVPSDRQRREFPPEKVAELASSIAQNGLIHPIVIRKQGESNMLVAGERRIRAIMYLWQFGEQLRCGEHTLEEGHVPCLYQGELDPIAAFEMELEENVQRMDLTWKERASAVAQLAALRRSQAQRRGEAEPTVAEISEEVRGSSEGYAHEATRRELILAKHLDDPDVAGAKTADEAFKILKRKEETSKHAERAERIGLTFSAAEHQLENADCREWLKGCPPNSFDIILTDPPYGMGADEFGDSGGRTAGAHGYEDSANNWWSLMTEVIPLTFLVAKSQAHMYIFCDLEWFISLRKLVADAGWTPFRTPLIWHKPNGIRAPWPENGPQRKYELILYAVKGKKPVTRIYSDVLSYSADPNLGHAAQKPVALFTDLLRRSAAPGDTVLDPFCGSGTIFPACHELKLRATGIEMDPASYGLAAKRLGELK